MKKIICVLSILYSQVCIAQNLVPNPSFENYDTCPDFEGQIERALGWLNFGGTLQGPATPDYYNGCSIGAWNVPNGGLCHQSAFNGSAYSAIYTFAPNVYREFVGVRLNQNLIIGLKYFVSIQICMGENFNSGCPSNKIGIRFSTIPFSLADPLVPDNFAHVYTDSIINDSINWHTVHGSFIADSTYQYLILGNFFDEAHTDTIRFNSNSYYSYYLIDDVCVSIDSTVCPIISNVTSNELELTDLYPNPVGKSLTIVFNSLENAEILIYNMLGQVLKKIEMKNERKKTIEVAEFKNGYYYLKINYKNKLITTNKKFIKI